MGERVVFVHGAGRSGADAWPAQRSQPDLGDLVFVVRFGFAKEEDGQPTDFDEDRRRVVEAMGDGAHLVAHSYGAVAALMAASSAPDRVRSVVLLEPACFSLARGGAAVEAHISAMSAALSDKTLSDEELFAAFLRSVGAEPPPGPLQGAALDSARRLRLQRGPWEADLDPAVIGMVPTLVVTSGDSELSEATAEVLESLGADRFVLPGTGHRPQDDPSANAVMRRLWAAASSGTVGRAARP